MEWRYLIFEMINFDPYRIAENFHIKTLLSLIDKNYVYFYRDQKCNIMEHGKMERLVEAMIILSRESMTVEKFAEKLGTSLKTAYRYIDTFKNAGLVLEKEQKCRYKIKRLEKKFKELGDLLYFTKEEAYILKSAIEGIDENNTIKQNLKKKLYSIYDFKMVADVVVVPKNRDIVQNIITAIETRKQVILHGYSSAHSNTVSDRLVEPFGLTTNYVQAWCYEPSTGKVKMFKIARIQSVEILGMEWQYEDRHVQNHIDIFRISSPDQLPIKLKLDLRATNLLMEEYPLSKECLSQVSDNEWILETNVCNYEGVTRFILGLYEDVKIMDSPKLLEFVNERIKKMAKQ